MSNSVPPSSPVFLVGPTGCGKSALAVEVAAACGAEIVNADPFQIWRGLEILTAQPPIEDQCRVPHHLYGFLDPMEEIDAAGFAQKARNVLTEIAGRGRRPLVVSGSGLYVKSLTHGLADVPPADAELRRRMDGMSVEELAEWLRKLDPAAEMCVNLQNPRHVQRAIEISILTGEPASKFKQAWRQPVRENLGVFLHPPRGELCQRIHQRTERMFADGVREEVARLGSLGRNAVKTIGLREIREVLSGALDAASAISSIQQATRRYAKRQVTWFKRETCFQPVADPASAKLLLAAML